MDKTHSARIARPGLPVLLLVGCGYAAALVAAHYLLPERFVLPAALCAALLLLPASLWKRRRAACFLLLLSAAAGFLWYRGYQQLVIAPAERFAGETRSVTVCVCDYPSVNADFTSVAVRAKDEALPPVRILVTDYASELDALLPGDLVSLPLQLRSAGVRYGEESDHYRADGIVLRGTLRGAPEARGRVKLAWRFAPRMLAKAIGTQALACFPEDVAPLMKALLTGDRQEYYGDEALASAMQTAGFSHIVAVSGMHVGFLIAALGLLAGGKRRRALLGIPLVVFFMAMIGFTPSVTRAGVMQIMLLLAPLLRREKDPPAALSAAALIQLLLNPFAIANVSFQLSFAAIAGLMLLSPRIYAWLTPESKTDSRLLRLLRPAAKSVCSLLAASVGASAFTVPIAAARFGSVPLYALFTNLLCLWAMTLAFMLGIPVCLLGLLHPTAGATAGWLVGWLPRYVCFVVRRIAALPHAALFMGSAAARWWLVSVYAVFLGFYFLRRRGKPFRPLLPFCISLAGLALAIWIGTPRLPGALTLTAVDVGQGQSFCALTENATVLIDCGSVGSPVNAGDAAADWLLSRGRDHVDLLVLTHFHADHANGVQRLMSRIGVERIAYPTDCEQSEYETPILARCEREGVETIPVSEDTTVRTDGLELRLFAPRGTDDVNEHCLLIRGDWGDFEFLVTGDAGAEVEQTLCAETELGDMELLVVGHHGSRHSTCDTLLEEITPEVAFISVGAGNSYGHPTEETLQRLADHGVAVYRTDLDGTISITVGESLWQNKTTKRD